MTLLRKRYRLLLVYVLPAFFDKDGHWYFHRVVSGRASAALLEEPPIGLSRGEAVARLQGTLVGPDGDTTCVVVTFTEDGWLEARRPIGRVDSPRGA